MLRLCRMLFKKAENKNKIYLISVCMYKPLEFSSNLNHSLIQLLPCEDVFIVDHFQIFNYLKW